MRKPKFGKNRTQSYIDFDTTVGTIRFGSEGNQLFIEINEQKTYLTDTSRNIIGAILADTLVEKTAGVGINADGVLLKDGVAGKVVAHLATDDGLTTGQLTGASQFVVITTANIDHIISLPEAAATPVGTVIRGMIAGTGCELRVHPDDAAAVKINDVTTSVEAAIPADTSIRVELISATEWILTAVDNLGAVVTAIVPDAVA